ncbi:GSCOCG00003661001-RA-CDS [Cotesia congregata]|nr:GSCOCG00003661001-RA-CDS [Cotesia congregata]
MFSNVCVNGNAEAGPPSFDANVGVIGPSLASHLSAMRMVSTVFCWTDLDSSSSVSS